MIPIRLKTEFEEPDQAPFVVRLSNQPTKGLLTGTSHGYYTEESGSIRCVVPDKGQFNLCTSLPEGDSLEGDVLLCVPRANQVQRLYRANSKHNTLLFTERCDQLCVMCSQPPRESNDRWRFKLYEDALELVAPDSVIGISGGEPTLYMEELLGLLERIADKRPDIHFHILSNGQHFNIADRQRLKKIHEVLRITWGIPLYANEPELHDLIVGKDEAFHRVMENLYLLGSTGATIELRTVLTARNATNLPTLAVFVADHLPFIGTWAIMAMEPIGFAKANREALFFDHSVAPQPLEHALDVCQIRDLPVTLYNFPRCTIPRRYRSLAAKSISDWKRKYLKDCALCEERDLCCGFFEWYSDKWSWKKIHPIGGLSDDKQDQALHN